MSRSFSYDLSLSGPPAEAQARVREVVTEELRQSAQMRLTNEDSNSLTFGPQWSWPLLVALSRRISGETVKLDFSAADGGTRVAVSGKVAGGAEKVAKQEFWTSALTEV